MYIDKIREDALKVATSIDASLTESVDNLMCALIISCVRQAILYIDIISLIII